MWDRIDLEEGLSLADEEKDNLKKAGHNLSEREPTATAPVADEGFEIMEIKDIFKYHT